ncbi:hypothetical protein Tco_1301349, partial [Tanacetum coccineum]
HRCIGGDNEVPRRILRGGSFGVVVPSPPHRGLRPTIKLSSTTITITIQRTTTTNKKSSEERRRGKRMAKRSTVDLDANEEEEEQSRQVSRWTREEEILLCQCLVEVFENNEIGVDRNEESF